MKKHNISLAAYAAAGNDFVTLLGDNVNTASGFYQVVMLDTGLGFVFANCNDRRELVDGGKLATNHPVVGWFGPGEKSDSPQAVLERYWESYK